MTSTNDIAISNVNKWIYNLLVVAANSNVYDEHVDGYVFANKTNDQILNG
jgi:hypothetical protein